MSLDLNKYTILQAVHTYTKTKSADHFVEFESLTEKEQDLVMQNIAIGEKKENVLAVMNASTFSMYKQGFALTEDKLYFSKDFYISYNRSSRYIEFLTYRHVEKEYPYDLVFKDHKHEEKLHVKEYVDEIYNFFTELYDILKSLVTKSMEQNQRDLEPFVMEKVDHEYFEIESPNNILLGDIIETPDGLLGISNIYPDARNAQWIFKGHNLTTQKYDEVKIDFMYVVKRLKRNRLIIGKARCKMDIFDVCLNLPNGKTAELMDKAIHKIDEKTKEAFYYELDNFVYFATSILDDKCAKSTK